MPVMIQIRNVDDEVHRTLKARAARAGMSLSDYLSQEMTRITALATIEELTERIRARPAVTRRTPTSRIVRRMRGR